MKILKETYNDTDLSLGFFDRYFKGMKYAVFDIETTGLSPKDCHVILSGFVLPKGDGQFELVQYFAQSISDEEEVLKATVEILNELDFVITFNGKRFDIPFILSRLSNFNIPLENDLQHLYNLDIYQVVKRFSSVKDFVPNLRQKTLENFLGLYETRDDQIDGAKCVEQYFEYLVTKDLNLEKTILLHNSDDVKQLYRLCAILKMVDFHKAMYTLGFPVSGSNSTVIEKIGLNKNGFHLSGRTLLPQNNIYDDKANLTLRISGEAFDLKVALDNRDGLLFVDLDKFSKDAIEYFGNCNGLYLDHFLLLCVDGEVNYMACNLLAKYLIERID